VPHAQYMESDIRYERVVQNAVQGNDTERKVILENKNKIIPK